MDADDRKMFARSYSREARSPETLVYDVLGDCEGGATAARLAERLLRTRVAIGLQAPVAKRVRELLDDLERAARVERIPDGRYRVVKARR